MGTHAIHVLINERFLSNNVVSTTPTEFPDLLDWEVLKNATVDSNKELKDILNIRGNEILMGICLTWNKQI
jgi:hypothetical protein